MRKAIYTGEAGSGVKWYRYRNPERNTASCTGKRSPESDRYTSTATLMGKFRRGAQISRDTKYYLTEEGVKMGPF